jgi:hypothetical protein
MLFKENYESFLKMTNIFLNFRSLDLADKA